jgi:hypothetical protein
LVKMVNLPGNVKNVLRKRMKSIHRSLGTGKMLTQMAKT